MTEKVKPGNGARILAVDDDPDSLFVLVELLKDNGFEVFSAQNGEETLRIARSEALDLILLDIQMPAPNGLEVTRELKSDHELRYTPIVLLTANSELEDVVKGFEFGADDYITKPFDPDELIARIRAALRTRQIYRELQGVTRENHELRRQVEDRSGIGGMVGQASSMQAIYDLIHKVKDSHVPVLIQGESGTGKELVAQAIHYQGSRRSKSFIAQNCSAFSESLLESELFGHLKGSFTGAMRDKPGLFELADGGTLFLDEIGEMKPVLQAKLLRVLQEGTFVPVGGTKAKKVDVRVVAATHRDLEKMIAEGTFREDLFYRLNVIRIKLPPLRERVCDIPQIASVLLNRIAERAKSKQKSLTPTAMKALMSYKWPGNVRELQNEIERLVLMSGEVEIIDIDLLDSRIANTGSQTLSANVDGGYELTLGDAISQLEKNMISNVLKRLNGNKSEAARVLGISRSNLINKVQEYKLE